MLFACPPRTAFADGSRLGRRLRLESWAVTRDACDLLVAVVVHTSLEQMGAGRHLLLENPGGMSRMDPFQVLWCIGRAVVVSTPHCALGPTVDGTQRYTNTPCLFSGISFLLLLRGVDCTREWYGSFERRREATFTQVWFCVGVSV